MKIKKKELRRGEAQLPINYPHPEVEEMQNINAEAFDAEKTRVESLCKRLAHNEVVVRDAVLEGLPEYIRNVTRPLLEVETRLDSAALRRFIATRNRRGGGKHRSREDHVVVNVLRELEEHRNHEENVQREQRRQAALRRLKQRRQQGEEAAANGDVDEANVHKDQDADDAGEDGMSAQDTKRTYRLWISHWSAVELLLLKLSRGLFFCLWHSDKPLVQLECAQRIARLIHAPQTNSGKILMFSCLMRVLVREWRTMDRYRADKFLAFVRKLVYELACLLRSLEEETHLQHRDGKSCIYATTTTTPSTTTTTTNNNKNNNNSDKGNNNNDDGANDADAASARKSSSLKRTSPAGKRKRPDRDDGDDADGAGDDEGDVACGMSDTVIIDDEVLTRDPLRRALNETCYVFQEQIFSDPIGVGLSMHICDVLFDELCRAALSPALFVALSDRVALYAMSRGNYVEKRVLDHFVSPAAGGVLATRRREQQKQKCERSQAAAVTSGRKKRRVDGDTASHDDSQGAGGDAKRNKKNKNNGNHDGDGDVEEEEAAYARADAETNAILLRLADCCKRHSVARRTVPQVRVMFTESELALRQVVDSDAYMELPRGAERRCVERELEDVEETRHAVMEERRKLRLLRQKEKKQQVRGLKKKTKVPSDGKEEGEGDAEGEEGARQKGTEKRKKKQPRDTKRKKHYTLTKEDLYGDE